MAKITPCLWFDGEAEEAANFYVTLLPDSRVTSVNRAAADYPGGKEGNVLVVEFTVGGQVFIALTAALISSSTRRFPSRLHARTRQRWIG